MRLDYAPARSARYYFAATLILLLAGLAPLPGRWAGARSLVATVRSPELNRADRDIIAGGYYEGLIGGGDGPEACRGELALRLLGKPADWTRFQAANTTRPLPGDFLQFELRPDLKKNLFGRPFTTNGHGQRDVPHTFAKPPGTFRVVVLGSSIDMGWGVDIDEIYVKMFERWLNQHAERRGLARRFEVVNLAVAAYSPVQRLETFRRKAIAFDPDLVIFSATMLDVRLTEIHLCDALQDPGVTDYRYDFVRHALAEAGIHRDSLRRDPQGKLQDKDAIKARLTPYYWPVYDAVLGTLAADCRSLGIPVACVIIPRVGKADAPEARDGSVARLRGIAAHHALTLYDLSGTFDGLDPTRLEIAAWDDHPNTEGHRRLFLALARALVRDEAMYQTLFPSDRGKTSPIPTSIRVPASSAGTTVVETDPGDEPSSLLTGEESEARDAPPARLVPVPRTEKH